MKAQIVASAVVDDHQVRLKSKRRFDDEHDASDVEVVVEREVVQRYTAENPVHDEVDNMQVVQKDNLVIYRVPNAGHCPSRHGNAIEKI